MKNWFECTLLVVVMAVVMTDATNVSELGEQAYQYYIRGAFGVGMLAMLILYFNERR